MVVGTLELHLRLDGCYSLKDKRQVLRSFLDRLRRDFQVAVAEVGDHDLWNVATVGVACVSNDAGHAESVLQHVLDVIDKHPEIEVEGVVRELVR
jgi:uncharacterized protein YlxP (DUF503 family)